MADEELKQLAFRVPASMLERIDACVDFMRKQTPGLEPSRSDVVRVLLEKGLAEFMRENFVPNTPGAITRPAASARSHPFPNPKRK